MSIGAIPANIPAMHTNESHGTGQNQQIKSLEQKLENLVKEKKEALQAKDTEKARKLEKQIQKQIAQLQAKAQKKQAEETQEEQANKNGKDETLGNYIDVYA